MASFFVPRSVICVLFLLGVCEAQRRGFAPSRLVTLPSGLNVRGSLNVDALVANGEAMSSNTVSASTVEANTINSKSITGLDAEIAVLRSSTGSIKVQGHLQVAGSIVYSDSEDNAKTLPSDPFQAVSLIEEDEEQFVPQWRLVRHEAFSGTSDHGFEHNHNGNVTTGAGSMLTHCADKNLFLGGHCSPVGGGGEASRVFGSIPTHTMIRITARFHFIDSWDGESAYTKIDGEYVWVDSHVSNGSSDGLSICGGPHPDTKMGTLVDVSLPHTADSLNLVFGSTLDGNSCEKSWGVDDIHLYVR